MLSKVLTSAVRDIKAVAVSVEVDISRGLPGINVVGLGDATVKEAAARIKSAIKNSGYEFPMRNITVNLSPAWIKKKGSQFDLPMAIGILISSGQIFDGTADRICFIGELSLDGRLNRCNGILPMIKEMRDCGIRTVVIPEANEKEGSLFDDIEVYCAENLTDVCDALNMKKPLRKIIAADRKKLTGEHISEGRLLDFRDVKGQEYAKRAITAAVSGGHGILITGSPGTGKTMLAERIPFIMPEPSFDEIIQMTSVYSVSGMINEDKGYISERPFRCAGSSVTKAGLIGGGNPLKPGEITMAHKGVLFIDEFYEIERHVLDSLRIPMEKKQVTFRRNGETFTFPADFLFVAAANPCRCGYYGDPKHECICTAYDIERYRNRVSGPVLDRIDINIELLPVEFDVLESRNGMSSEEMREIIENARYRQRVRYKFEKISLNSELSEGMVERYAVLGCEEQAFLKEAYIRLDMNPRGVFKIRKLARTLADIDDEENIGTGHIAEALRYRGRSIK